MIPGCKVRKNLDAFSMSDSFKTKKDIELNVRKIAWPGILAG